MLWWTVLGRNREGSYHGATSSWKVWGILERATGATATSNLPWAMDMERWKGGRAYMYLKIGIGSRRPPRKSAFKGTGLRGACVETVLGGRSCGSGIGR